MLRSFILFVFLWMFAWLAARNVSVTNLHVVPRQDGSKLVDITYTLVSTDTNRVFVRTEVSFDNGSSYRYISYKNLTGDIGWVVPGGDKFIKWNINNTAHIYDGDSFIIKLTVDDNKDVSSNQRYVAIGNADFFWEDYNIIIPLLEKYGFSQSFYLQTRPMNDNPDLSVYSIDDINKIYECNSDMGDHTYAHFAMTTSCPLADGYNTPTNNDFRADRGDGRNAFGLLLTESVGTYCPSSYLHIGGVSYDSLAWSQLTDQNCEDLRKTLSVFRRPNAYYQGSNVRLLESLDYLSNKYLGTTGTGRNILVPSNGLNLPVYGDQVQYDTNNRISGGIFQGCATTANHEIWERLMQLHSCFHSDLLGTQQVTKSWFSSGGLYRVLLYRNVGIPYSSMGMAYLDAALMYPASVYTKLYNSRTGQYRSLYDAEFSVGYRTGFEAHLENGRNDGRVNLHFNYPNKLNSGEFNADYDCLATPHGMILHYYTLENGYSTTEIQDMAASTNALQWLYDRDKQVVSGSERGLYNALNNVIKWTSWGTIPKFADDSGQQSGPHQLARRAMLAIQIDAFFKFCYLAGIQIVSYEKAIEICKQSLPSGTNLFPNPFFIKTIDSVIGSTVNPQINPDGWLLSAPGAITNSYDNSLHSEYINVNPGNYGSIRQYMIKPGQLTLNFKAKGVGTFQIYSLLNKDYYYNTQLASNLIASISVDSENWTDYTAMVNIPLSPLVQPTYNTASCNGRDNQICGLSFVLSANTGDSGVSFALPILSE